MVSPWVEDPATGIPAAPAVPAQAVEAGHLTGGHLTGEPHTPVAVRDDAAPAGAGGPGGAEAVRVSRRGRLWTAAFVVAVLTGPAVLLSAYLRRPFWYDEIWRGHFVSEPVSSLWSELSVANTPSALGWLGLVRLSGEILGWHGWALRLPGLLAVPALGVAIAVLVRRFAGPVAAVAAVCLLCLNATFLDLASQLKPYAIETLAVVAVVLLWLGPTPGGRDERARGTRRTAAGIVALCAVPAVFVVVPLAALDVLTGAGKRRRRLAEVLPAVGLVTAHTLVFLGHQSAQRGGVYWDTQFLAGRDLWEALVFIADQLWLTVTGSPPGIDRFDPSLLPVFVELPHQLPWLLAPATVGFGVVGVAALLRRPDGRQVLGVVAGAELLMLAASAVRFWPFGPTRTNQFLVPLLLLVVLVGADRVVRRALRSDGLPFRLRGTVGAVSAVMAVVLAAGVAAAGGLSGDGLLWERRDRLRGMDLTVDAAVAARRLVRPGDVVVVGGRLARPGWIYAMEVNDDAPRFPGGLPSVPAGTPAGREPARVPRTETVFVQADLRDDAGRLIPLAAQLARPRKPERLVVFVLDIEEREMAPGLAVLRADGWCAGERWSFRLTGTVTVYGRCAA